MFDKACMDLTDDEFAKQYGADGIGMDDNWIQGAIKHRGALGVKEGEKIPAEKLKQVAKGHKVNAKRARLAMTLKKINANK